MVWFIWQIIKNRGNYLPLALFVWFFIPFVFFSVARTKMQNYMLITSPALFIITAEFWYMLRSFIKNHKLKWLFNIILILLIALPARYAIERIKPFSQKDRKPQWVLELKRLNDMEIENGILLNYERSIEAMFYTDHTVYGHIPKADEIIELIDKGYRVLLNDTGNIPDEIKNIEGIILLDLSGKQIIN
jgi:4-amino-4-deoxy-L-arabinose transferase